MPGPNTTGLPSTSDYVLGRGRLYFAALTGTGQPGAYRDLGNVPSFTMSVEIETLEHKSSRSGLKVVDKNVVVSQKVTAKIELDEMNFENYAQFFGGSQATPTNAAIAGFAEQQMIANVELGRWYDIYDPTTKRRAYDIQSGDLTVEKQGAPDVALVLDTDYKLDTKFGLIMFLSTAVNVAAGDEVDVTLAAQAGAKPVKEVRGLTTSSVAGALKFIQENPANGDKAIEVQIHKIALNPSGDASFIGDDWQKITLEGVAEKNESNPVDGAGTSSPYFTIRYHDDS